MTRPWNNEPRISRCGGPRPVARVVLLKGVPAQSAGVPTSAEETTAVERVPNPWGSRGSPPHQALAEEIAGDVPARGLMPAREYPITNFEGDIVRRVDMAGLRNGVPEEFHQVGLVTQSGFPIAREWDALVDIYGLTGIWPEFHPYGIR